MSQNASMQSVDHSQGFRDERPTPAGAAGARRGGDAERQADARWAAVVARDASCDGTFFYSVRTTGVFCNPSCAARPPRRANVAFHETADDARAAGYRACKRCRPESPPLAERQAALVAEICRRIEQADGVPSLDEIAEHAAMSPSHVHRLFRRITGITPRAYAAQHRAMRVRGTLTTSASVTDAIYDAGYNSNARFYEKSHEMLGMTPTRYRAGGKDMTIRFAIAACSLGMVLVASTERGVCAILLGDTSQDLVTDLERRFANAAILGADAGFDRTVAEVVALVEQPGHARELPLDIRGTVFQQRVWQALRRIPAGSTASYAEIADAIGAPGSARAVAQACAANRLAVAIPCHRATRSDGSLSGYRWGHGRKRELLERESAS